MTVAQTGAISRLCSVLRACHMRSCLNPKPRMAHALAPDKSADSWHLTLSRQRAMLQCNRWVGAPHRQPNTQPHSPLPRMVSGMSRSKLAAVDTSALMRQLASSCVAGACEARLLPRLPPPLLEDRVDLATPFPCCGLLPRLPCSTRNTLAGHTPLCSEPLHDMP
jgi:hypothetical protein